MAISRSRTRYINNNERGSTEYLRTEGLFAEPEGLPFAIQDQIIKPEVYPGPTN